MDDLEFWELGGDVTPDQAVVLARLRRLACPPCLSCMRDADEGLLFTIDVDAPDVALLTGGVRFEHGSMHADRLSIHDLTFPPSPTRWAITAAGPPDELAVRAADWFKTFSAQTIVRHEWLHRGNVFASCYILSDTGERLAQRFIESLAPDGVVDRLIREGHVRGKGWLQTEGLGLPDRVALVRGPAPGDA